MGLSLPSLAALSEKFSGLPLSFVFGVSGLLPTFYFLLIHGRPRSNSQQRVQGDPAPCSKPPVDIDLKLGFSKMFLFLY